MANLSAIIIKFLSIHDTIIVQCFYNFPIGVQVHANFWLFPIVYFDSKGIMSRAGQVFQILVFEIQYTCIWNTVF